MVISLIHPSRSRPQKAFNAAQRWISKAGCQVEYRLSIDDHDPFKGDYLTLFEDVNLLYTDFDLENIKVSMLPNRSAIDAINNAAEDAKQNIIVVMSDDFDCPHDWGKKIIESTKGKTDWIAKTPDGIQSWLITLPIMDRAYYNRFGYIYHPDYAHMFCDTELTCVADLTGRKITLDIPFVHNHYSTGRSQKDEVSIKADATWAQGESLFLSRAKNKFGLQNPPGKITSVEYINWMRQKGISI